MNLSYQDDLRLIEAGFPCHQVGAETQRERGASSALPPLYFLHVWWARRPLTPSRAAILASLLPSGTDPDWFIKQLGILKKVVEINGVQWVLDGKIPDKIFINELGQEILKIDQTIFTALNKENLLRSKNLEMISKLKEKDSSLFNHSAILLWENESKQIPLPFPNEGVCLKVLGKSANPAWFKELMLLAGKFSIRVPNLYGYDRAYKRKPVLSSKIFTILDPTAGGGSIPFEALRLGHNVIANDINPVAVVILYATLRYPTEFGLSLLKDIKIWGDNLLESVEKNLYQVFPKKFKLPSKELEILQDHLSHFPEIVSEFNEEDTTTYLYCRQVICPHCGGDAPLLNTCWLSKESGKQWGVKIIPDGKTENGTVNFETFRVADGKGPKGEDPNFATVNRAVGLCIHCRQAIAGDEIKAQARGESGPGKWEDRLYCIVAVRFQPKLDKHGNIQRYKSGAKKDEIKTEKIRFFRTPNSEDFKALEEARIELEKNWDHWDELGLIPTENIPLAHKTKEPIRVGMTRWCDMFTPRQLLGHLSLMEELIRLKPQILEKEGEEKGKAIITYLQFAIDKGLDYNSRQTRWEYTRGVVKGTFGRHDFSLKWTFGEMIFSGPNSGAAWGLSQVLAAYKGIAELAYNPERSQKQSISIINNTAANLNGVTDSSVDLICMDPPYYNNVQYAELSDYFYVWQKRMFKDVYPQLFNRRLTNKQDEAVANPDRDGGTANAHKNYEKMMREIFIENRRVLKENGLLTLMFTHKSQAAWEALTQALIESGWIITASFPVESETQQGFHTKGTASAISSVFISCRKRLEQFSEPATWSGFGGAGVQQRIRETVKQALKDFKSLRLNPVDEMVACYGKALSVLSEQWPVLDGDEPVGPIRAMNEASRIVAENQIIQITHGQLSINDLLPEAAMALTLYGIYGLEELPYDEALNLSRSLNIKLESKTGGYSVDARFIGINNQSAAGGNQQKARAEDLGFHAPLIRKGSKLRLALPEERNAKRLDNPQTEWDLLHGLIIKYREGDIPVARAYMSKHAEGKEEILMNLLSVWTTEMGDEDLRKEGNTILFGLK